ncbi:MAG: glycosyltransferase [Polyangiaceae bacterium]|nr:glycosyltransferase [Polyangiaceae bacterium]
MRIVVVTTSFPRSEDDPSGHFVRSSAEALAKAGNEVLVIAPGGSLLDPPRRLGDLIVYRAGGGSLFAWPGALARVREAPWRLFAAGPFALGVMARLRGIGPVDHAVAHWMVPSAWPLLMKTRSSLEVFAHGADVRVLVKMPAPAREMIVGSLLERASRITFAARSLEAALRRALSPEVAEALDRVSHVDPPAIDVPDVTARACELRSSLNLAPGERLVSVVCRLVASKRVDFALEAAALVKEAPIRVVIVGDGPERAALEQRAGSLGLRSTFLGAQPRREALAWVAASDVLLHPSAIEGAPTVIREARALDVHVVACDAGDVSAWADDDPGIAVAAPTAPALAAAVERMI